jgi:hypothetical protein
MRAFAARSSSGWAWLAVVAPLLALYAGCTSQSSERRGGTDVPDLGANTAASGAGGALGEGGASGEAGAPAAAPPVTWCAAYNVITCVCQQCHQNPTVNQAPFPLVTYDDTQMPYQATNSKKKVWQEMQLVVASGFMPYQGIEDPPVDPPVKPLSDERKATLLTWLAQGAHDEGGQDCPMVCDWRKGPPDGGQ